MLKEQLSEKLQLLNATRDDYELNELLQPVLVQGMRRGFQAAYLYIIGVSSGVDPSAQPANWVDQVEQIANAQFVPFVADVDKKNTSLGKEVISMLSEESHAVVAHQGNILQYENLIMPYFNGWFLGYYHALLIMLSKSDDAANNQEDMQKNASDQAMQAVTAERQSFQKQLVYQDSVCREILKALQ